MRESRLIIIISICLFIFLGPTFYLFYKMYPNLLDYMNIATNLYCGIIVALITSICQYCATKRKIINNVYSTYFDLYRTYYYSKNQSFLLHYNSYSVYKKMVDMNPKIVEALDEYHGLFRKHDRTYKMLNPTINLDGNYKAKKMIKALLYFFNRKSFDVIFGPLIKNVESILININKKRFEQDKADMVKMYNYMWDKNN